MSVIRSLVDRAFNLCSPEFLEQELDTIKKTLKSNGYQAKQINKIIRNKRNSQLHSTLPAISHNNPLPIPQNSNNTNNPQIKYVAAPYIKGTSERMNRVLQRENIVLANKPSTSLKSKLSHLKDPIPPETRNNVIYQIPCRDCSGVYIGETGRNISKRTSEHKQAVQRRDPNSQVSQHITQNLHQMDWAEAKILDSHCNFKSRKFLEACYTISNANSFNRREDIAPVFIPVVKEICEKIQF